MALSTPSPAHEATGIANNATLSWADSVESDYYKVYFGTNSAEVTAKSPNVYRGNVTPKAYDPRLDLIYGAKYYWLITAVKAGESDVDSAVWDFTIITEAAGLPDAKKYRKKICSAANDKFFYDNDDSPPVQVELSGLTLDTSKAISMFELDQKVYIANDAILKVVDFVNTKLTLNDVMEYPARRGQEITQANSEARMIVDYVAKGALTVIYGRTTSGIFDAYATIAISAVADGGAGTVNVTTAGHAFLQGQYVTISGTTDYDGLYLINSVTTDTFNITKAYTTTKTGTATRSNTLSGDTMSPTTRWPTAVALPTTPHHYTWGIYANCTLGAEFDEFGAMPPRATIGVPWRGRADLTGNSVDPHQWYLSRQMNPYDMKYGEDDEQSAVAGTDAKAGKVGDIITASIPYSDDYKLYGSIGDLWVLRGDPAAGGNLDCLIEGIGVVSQTAWCWDDAGNLYVLDLKGMYKITRGLAAIEPMTSDKIPNFTKDLALNPETQRIVLSFDPAKQGIVISVTTIETGANVNYFYDLQSGGFSPETHPVQDAIMCSHYYDADDPEQRRLLFGSYDGHMRILDPASKSDDTGSMASPASVAIESYVLLGPVMIGANHNYMGRMNSLTVVTAGGKAGGTVPDSDDVDYAVYVGDDAETVMEKADADGMGPELVLNSGFNNETHWTLGTQFSVVDGKLQWDCVDESSDGTTYQIIARLVEGRTYRVTFSVSDSTVSGNDASVRVYLGGNTVGAGYCYTNGAYELDITAGAGNKLEFDASAEQELEAPPYIWKMGNVSVREIITAGAGTRTSIFNGTIPAPGKAKRIRRKARGVFIAVRLGNISLDKTWGMERVLAEIEPAGRAK